MERNLSLPHFTERALREKAHYDEEGLDRQGYNEAFSHTKYYYRLRRNEILQTALDYANGRNVLELGSQGWIRWIEGFNILPAKLECINISSRALESGAEKANSTRVKPTFCLMDANNLDFPSHSFDLVFGDAILHHLNFTRALDEIRRVLKPGGRIVFSEPLGVNPVAKLVRLLTPNARTRDERPLSLKDIAEIQKRFDATLYYEQFLTVPVGVVSRLLFSDPANFATRLAFELDTFLDRKFPPLRPLYRNLIITGASKS